MNFGPDVDGQVVYFVQGKMGGPVKIGTAKENRLDARLRELQCGNPDLLEVRLLLDGGRVFEALVHRQFAHLRLRGEWFHCAGELEQLLSRSGPSPLATPPANDAEGFPADAYEAAFHAGFDSGLRLGHEKASANFGEALSLIARSVNGQIDKARRVAAREVGQCEAIVSKGPRRGKQCRSPNLPGSRFCKRHQQASAPGIGTEPGSEIA